LPEWWGLASQKATNCVAGWKVALGAAAPRPPASIFAKMKGRGVLK